MPLKHLAPAAIESQYFGDVPYEIEPLYTIYNVVT